MKKSERIDRTLRQQATVIRMLAASVAVLKRTTIRTSDTPTATTAKPHSIRFTTRTDR